MTTAGLINGRPIGAPKPKPKKEPDPVPRTAADFHKNMLVWWKEPGRDRRMLDKAAWVLSVNQEQDTVLIGFFQEPTATREEGHAIVSPRVLRPRAGKD
jgi:hypothetical protein